MPVSKNEDLRPNTSKNIKDSKIMKGRAPSCLEFSMLDVDFVRLSSILCITQNGFHSKRNKRDSIKQNLKYIVRVGHRGLGADTFCLRKLAKHCFGKIWQKS